MLTSRKNFVKTVVERMVSHEWLFPGLEGIETEAIIHIREVGDQLTAVDLLWYANLKQNGYSRLVKEIENQVEARLKEINPLMKLKINGREDVKISRSVCNQKSYKVGRWPIRVKRRI